MMDSNGPVLSLVVASGATQMPRYRVADLDSLAHSDMPPAPPMTLRAQRHWRRRANAIVRIFSARKVYSRLYFRYALDGRYGEAERRAAKDAIRAREYR